MAILHCAKGLHAREPILPRCRPGCVEKMTKRAGKATHPTRPLDVRRGYSGRGVTVAEVVVIEASDFTVMYPRMPAASWPG